jgi:Peptidase A4 family
MDASRGVAGRRAGWLAGRRPRGAAARPAVRQSWWLAVWGMSGWRRRRGEDGRRRGWAGVLGLAGGPAAVYLVAAAGLVLGAATAQNGSWARQGHQRGGHERVRLLAATLTPGAWSGYVIKGGANDQVSATFTVPTVFCQTWQNGPGSAFWVGIQSTDSNGTTTIVQDGIGVNCTNGQPQYYAGMVPDAYAQVAVPLPDKVQPGDAITAAVYEFGSWYAMAVSDPAENWNEFNFITGGADSSNWAAVAAESYNGGAFFYPVAVTGADVNGSPLGQFNPEADEQHPSIYQGTAGLDPSPLDASGQNFSFYWNGWPNLAPSARWSFMLAPALPQ